MIQIIPSELKRLYKVLPRLYRLRLLKVGISVFIMAVLDLVGTGVLLPVLLLVLNENIILENRHMALFYSWMGFDSIRSFVFFICIVVLLFQLYVFVCLPGCSINRTNGYFIYPVICPFSFIRVIIHGGIYSSSKTTAIS